MNDAEFLRQVEAGTIAEFPHRAHLRMAWLYLRAEGFEAGSEKICATIRHLAAAKGAPGKYHETITLFWAHLVQYAMSLTPEIDDFDVFIATHDHLLNPRLLTLHYSPALLASSRAAWAAPDLIPLPGGEVEQEAR
jgi:hypothetical protein